ncbi:hypothetical protein BH23GEM6_BH23GEM6_26910 [soil metagenome]
MPVPRNVFSLVCASFVVMAGCTDGPFEPKPEATRQDGSELPLATSSQLAGDLVGTLTIRDGGGSKIHSFAVTRGDLRSSPVLPEFTDLRASLRTLAPAKSREARMAAALVDGTAAERVAASAPYLRGVTLHSSSTKSLGRSDVGSLRRGDREWISWSIGQNRSADGVAVGEYASGRTRERRGDGMQSTAKEQATVASNCIDCSWQEEDDYDPYFDPNPPVWEMAEIYAFAMDLEAIAYMAPLPQECIGYQAAFASALATTLSVAAVTTVSAYARMPATTAKYGRLSVQGVFAAYVAWEFLEACKRQYRN